MLKLLAVATLAMVTPATAATFDCVDPKGEITLEIVETYVEAAGVFGLVSATFKVMDELGYTSADDPSNDGDVTLVNVAETWDRLDFDMHLINVEKGYDTIVGSVRLSRAQEGAQQAVGGTLHVSGGGAWAVACIKAD